jgi:hypothetical protein
MWGHIIGGAQGGNDKDNPIASSHKGKQDPRSPHPWLIISTHSYSPLGPTMYYMAKVDDPATASGSGLQWFKIFEDGLDGSGQWGVDRMINAGGWVDFTMPTCVAPGKYLLRAEIIALHNASKQGGAQFYIVRPILSSIKDSVIQSKDYKNFATGGQNLIGKRSANMFMNRAARKSMSVAQEVRPAPLFPSQERTRRATLAFSLASMIRPESLWAMDSRTRSLDRPNLVAKPENVGLPYMQSFCRK